MAAAVLLLSLAVFIVKGVEFSEETRADRKPNRFNITVLTEEKKQWIVETFLKNYTRVNVEQSNLLNINVEGIEDNTPILLSLLKRFSNPGFLKAGSFIVMDLPLPSSFHASILGTLSSVVFDIRNRPFYSQDVSQGSDLSFYLSFVRYFVRLSAHSFVRSSVR